jgi:hypothetical protein
MSPCGVVRLWGKRSRPGTIVDADAQSVVDAGRATRPFDRASTLVVDYGIKAATVNMAQ